MALEYAFQVPKGDFACAECGAKIPTPGICDPCGNRGPKVDHEAKLRRAHESIPERFRWARFTAEELRERVASGALAVVQSLFGQRLPLGVVLHGPAGAGKTSLACAMLARIHNVRFDDPAPVVERARRAVFVSVPELRSQLQEWRKGTEAPELLRLARGASVLVLDDLDDHRRDELVDLMSERHNRERPTIVTTWLSREEAARVYGDRLVRRVYEQVIPC